VGPSNLDASSKPTAGCCTSDSGTQATRLDRGNGHWILAGRERIVGGAGQSARFKQPDKFILQSRVGMDIVAAVGGGPALDCGVRVARFAVRSQKISQSEMPTDIVRSRAKRMDLMCPLRGSLDEVTTPGNSILSARLVANPEEGGSQ